MIFTAPVPFTEARALLEKQGLLPSDLSAADLAKIKAEIRRVAEFSAHVTDEHFLNMAHDVVSKIVDPGLTGRQPGSYMDKSTARAQLREYLERVGYSPEPGREGSIQDLMSDGRLNLIVETRTQMIQGHARHLQSHSKGAVSAFPAQELYRLESRVEPRDWRRRWVEAGGRLYGGGRMIARKDDPIWTEISSFGNPYPPYDYNSGMWVRDISRKEAIDMGVITPEDQVNPQEVDTAEELTAGVENHSPALVQAATDSLRAKGVNVEVRDGKIVEVR
jgi:hypothetical protein